VEQDDDHYSIPSTLVHSLIGTILVSLLAIAGYMVVWAKSDAEWKATLLTKFSMLEGQVTKIDQRVETGQLPLSRQRIDTLEQRVIELERAHRGDRR